MTSDTERVLVEGREFLVAVDSLNPDAVKLPEEEASIAEVLDYVAQFPLHVNDHPDHQHTVIWEGACEIPLILDQQTMKHCPEIEPAFCDISLVACAGLHHSYLEEREVSRVGNKKPTQKTQKNHLKNH